jgi:hypothetical protein
MLRSSHLLFLLTVVPQQGTVGPSVVLGEVLLP